MSTNDDLLNIFHNDFNVENELEALDKTNKFNVEKDLYLLESNKIHIWYQQRTRKKGITIIEGLDETDGIDFKKFIKYIQKNLCCSGTIKKHKEKGKIIQFQGDHRTEISKILEENYKITVHGA